MMKDAYAFGTSHSIQIRADKASVTLSIDGRDPARRDRQPGPIRLDEITVGARFYSNEATPPRVQGFFDGDIAEILLYDRALTDAECLAVRALSREASTTGLDRRLAQLAHRRASRS